MPKPRSAATRRQPRVFNCIASRETDKDWRMPHANAAGLLGAPAALPAAIDLRSSWWKIGNQESTGSCVGWAAADGQLRWHFVRAGRLRRNEPLSVRFVWMAAKETDEHTSMPTTFLEVAGTSLKSALDIARKFGCVPERLLPFDGARLYPHEPQTFFASAAERKIASYINLGRNLDDWKRWLALKGPVLTRLDVDEPWMKARHTKGNLDRYRPETIRPPAGHAVLLAGYTPSRFIVRNSWGTEWGDGGFAYASREYAEAAFTEAYGVNV